jgi:hypothetical protein
MHQQNAALALHHLVQHAATKTPHALQGETPSSITHGLIGVVIAFIVLWLIIRVLGALFSPRRAD